MRNIRYAEGTVLVSDELGDALMSYSRELARNGSADVVDVPVYFEEREDVVKMLLGPASQLVDEPAPSSSAAPDSAAVVDEILHRLDLLGPARPIPEEPRSEGHEGFTEQPIDEL